MTASADKCTTAIKRTALSLFVNSAVMALNATVSVNAAAMGFHPTVITVAIVTATTGTSASMPRVTRRPQLVNATMNVPR